MVSPWRILTAGFVAGLKERTYLKLRDLERGLRIGRFMPSPKSLLSGLEGEVYAVRVL